LTLSRSFQEVSLEEWIFHQSLSHGSIEVIAMKSFLNTFLVPTIDPPGSCQRHSHVSLIAFMRQPAIRTVGFQLFPKNLVELFKLCNSVGAF
jgi:hypothetical protein